LFFDAGLIHCVIAGLDPAIQLGRSTRRVLKLDHRVSTLRVGPVMTLKNAETQWRQPFTRLKSHARRRKGLRDWLLHAVKNRRADDRHDNGDHAGEQEGSHDRSPKWSDPRSDRLGILSARVEDLRR